MGDDAGHVLEHYILGLERDRLATPLGIVEFERTKEEIAGHLPPPPATVVDIGSGPGRYSIWLAELGYSVVARDLVPRGIGFVAAISRWAPRLHAEVVQRLYREFPAMRDEIGNVERSGVLPPLYRGSFAGYCHRPAQLRREIVAAGLVVGDLMAVEGLAFALPDLEERLAHPVDREIVLNAARRLGRVPELVGLGPHLLAVVTHSAQRTMRA